MSQNYYTDKLCSSTGRLLLKTQAWLVFVFFGNSSCGNLAVTPGDDVRFATIGPVEL